MTTKRVVFLDDDPIRCKFFQSAIPSAVIVTTAEEVQAVLADRENQVDILLLDHDLGGEIYVDPELENSGSGVVRWMRKHNPPVGRIIVHSYNGPAAAAMCQDLTAIDYRAEYLPFSPRLVDMVTAYMRELGNE